MNSVFEIVRLSERFLHKFLERNMLISGVFGTAFDQIIDAAILALSERHFVGKNYRLPRHIEMQFVRSLEGATTTFINKLADASELSDKRKSLLNDYLSSSEVTSEFSKLLEPGTEYFDIYKLTNYYSNFEKNDASEFSEKEILEAWSEFRRAFSFASRARSEFRGFLRASYEEGSFLAISNIRDAVESLEKDIETVNGQKESLSGSIRDYEGELESYVQWAKNFHDNREKGMLQ